MTTAADQLPQPLLRTASFRWLMGGALVSALGDQFTLIALPWLVLVTTGDAATMGLVIALASVPRALFMLLGGAVVDRYSPRTVQLLSKYANVVLLSLLAVLVMFNLATLPVIGALALALGLASAFGIPSATSMLPHVVAPAQLASANGIMMGVRQLTMLAGPLLAALIFVVGGDGSAAGPHSGAAGLAWAFGLDALSFAVSAWTLRQVTMLPAPPKPPGAPAGMFAAVVEGLATLWRDRPLRALMLYWALCAVVVGGTLQVALPVLASTRLHGASALGLVMAANGAGTLIGMGLSGTLGKLRVGSLGSTVLLIDGLLGVLMIPMGMVQFTWQAVALMLAAGMLAGVMQVAVFSWIQQRVARAMLGRAMSIFMFIFMGLAPIAAALTGLLMNHVGLTALFAGAGCVLICAAALAYLTTTIRVIDDVRPADLLP